MTLIRFDQVSRDVGHRAMLQQADFAIDTGERVCLIGRSGAGKTTTLRLIAGEVQPEHGEIVRKNGLVVSQLAQSLPPGGDASVREVVASGLSEVQALLDEYQERSQHATHDEAMHDAEEPREL